MANPYKRKLTMTDRITPRTCIEAFCGAGGMSIGLAQAGFEVRLAIDYDAAAVAS